ncbi:hypothetical protein [Ferruginibacter albus]|uniref:hypothetical protein n=1 Tax=Ferruginibacter albus TaxID=2875540 RepID=UPI001CC3AB74|nr:hypothetical protein [Ferruginibacter albus]UAY50897.1 hypothetical protein K9M53_09875 [Ferruginibacter albus]
MKKLIATAVFIHCLTFSFGQNAVIKAMVDSLQYLKAGTLDCKADLYWRIIAKGSKAIPFLIDKLNDTTSTNISHKCKATKLNVGEVSYFALQEIGDFPAFVITHIQFDVSLENGCWVFFDYFFDNANKTRYKQLVNTWYKKNKPKFKVQKILKKDQTDCQKRYKINTYLNWED